MHDSNPLHNRPPFDPPLSPEELEAAAAANAADLAAEHDNALAELNALKACCR
jgi:hypothetical protein